MDSNELRANQEMLKSKKRERMYWIMFAVLVTIFLISIYGVIVLQLISPKTDFHVSIALLLGCIVHISDILVIRWATRKTVPIEEEIKNLECQIEELLSVRKIDEFAAKIRAGIIKPDPNLQ